MKDFFKPEDFQGQDFFTLYRCEEMAKAANEKLNKLIESWPVVYGYSTKSVAPWSADRCNSDTHKARLAFVEEIVKEPCKHEPDLLEMFQKSGLQNSKCKHCGVELQATWSEKK